MCEDDECAGVIPDVSPMNSLAAMRAFYWLNEADPEVAVKLAKGVFRAHWAEGRDLSPAEAVAAEAAALDIDANALIEAIQDPTIKELLEGRKRRLALTAARSALRSSLSMERPIGGTTGWAKSNITSNTEAFSGLT